MGATASGLVVEEVGAATLANSALVFIKPHANTEATRAYVRERLIAAGCTINHEGEITGAEIDEKKLIDQHYYAIASKATLVKPAELAVPADKFESFFGISWSAALESNKVLKPIIAIPCVCTDLALTPLFLPQTLSNALARILIRWGDFSFQSCPAIALNHCYRSLI
jgi:hypothetical protein